MTSRFKLLSMVMLVAPASAMAQAAPQTVAAKGGFSGSKINHVVLCDTYYANAQACVTAAGTTNSVILPFGQHVGDTYTNPNSVSVMDLRGSIQLTDTSGTSFRIDNSGATLTTGGLFVPSDPTTALQVATKHYTDGFVPLIGGTMTGQLVGTSFAVSGQPQPIPNTVTMFYHKPDGGSVSGVAAIGANSTTAGSLALIAFSSDLSVNAGQLNIGYNSAAGYNSVTSTVPIVLPSNPTHPMDAATMAYVDAHAGAGISLAPGDGISIATSGGVTTISAIPAFAINSFTPATTVELGATVTNPTFSASYTVTPTSASITNTDGTGSPTNLTTPFTSGTVPGSFSKTTSSCVVFTLTAAAATTKTATQNVCFRPRTFYGVGTAGATSATASGTSAVLSGGAGTIGTWGLATETGTVSVTTSSQYIYFLLSGSSHTFSVNGFGTTFNSTTFSFVNANGVTTTMTLYVSPTYYTGTYPVQVN